MKNVFKRMSIVLVALMLVSTIYVLSDSHEVLADENYTVTFHYLRSDGDFDGLQITVYPVVDSETAKVKSPFSVNGNEGTLVYNFVRHDDDIIVSFIVQKDGVSDPVEERTSIELEDDVTSMDVYFKQGNAEDYQTVEPSDWDTSLNSQSVDVTSQTETTSQTVSKDVTQPAEQPTTAAQTGITSESTSQTSTQSIVAKENNKDYSVGFFQALIVDIILFAILGGLSFVALSKEKKVKKK